MFDRLKRWFGKKEAPKPVQIPSFSEQLDALDRILERANTNPQPPSAIQFPGWVTFDPVEFAEFKRNHPELGPPCSSKYTVKAHPGGVVGITPKGFHDPGPPEDLIDDILGRKKKN